MKRREKQGAGCLLALLMLVGFPSLLIWRELRRARLSSEMIAVLKEVRFVSNPGEDSNTDRSALQGSPEEILHRDEVRAIRLLQEGADPNARDFAELHRTFWEEAKFLLQQTFRRHAVDAGALPPSALTIAVEADNNALVLALLRAGANDVNAIIKPKESDTKFSLVGYAAHNGNVVMVQELCAHGADIHLPKDENDPEAQDASLLQMAIESYSLAPTNGEERAGGKIPPDLERERRAQIFHFLLARGAKYTPRSVAAYGILSEATYCDFRELTRELLAAGVPPTAPHTWVISQDDLSPLAAAVQHDDIALTKLLLQYGADAKDHRQDAPILLAKSPAMAQLLLAHGADRHTVLQRGKYAGANLLAMACREGDLRMVSFWIEQGLDVNSGRGVSFTPIEAAALYGDVPMVRLLLEHGAKIGPDSPGGMALWLAIADSHFDIARLLLHYGASANAQPRAPLTAAAEQDDIDMARELLERGADAKDGEALLAACEACDEDLVELLLEHGANPNVRRNDDTTPIELAKESADPPEDADGIMALLKRYGVKQQRGR